MRLVRIAYAVFTASIAVSATAWADDPPKPDIAPPATAPDQPPTAPPAAPTVAPTNAPPGAPPDAPPPPGAAPPPRPRLIHPSLLQRGAAPPPPPAPQPAPPAAPPPPPPPEPAEPPQRHEFGDPNVGVDGYPVAGFHGGRFFLRDRHDYFRLYVGGRLHLDSYNYFGPGVSDTALKSTFLLRRARVELGGEAWGHWQWLAQIESAPTGIENATGTNQQYAAPVGVEPTASTPQYAAVQTPSYRVQPVQVYANYTVLPLLNVQFGQFNLPFTMENRTSTNTGTFLERSLAVRAWGIPEIREPGVSLWGNLDKRLVGYAIALSNGDGYNRLSVDNRFKGTGRVFTRPLARTKGPLDKLQVGGSFKYAMHDKNRVAYDVPSPSTQSNYAFWSPSYTDSLGRRTHIIPSGEELGFAGELRVPFRQFDLRSEFVYLKTNTREGVDGYQSTYTERFGTMKGYGYYVQLSYWLLGSSKITGDPGDQSPPKMDLTKPDAGIPPQGLELAAKWEQLNVSYESATRDGTVDSKNIDGDIRVNAVTAGINYWASRHFRLTLNYTANMFPDSAPKKATAAGGPTWSSSQRAQAPGNTIASGVDDDARDNAHTLHEVSARVGIAF